MFFLEAAVEVQDRLPTLLARAVAMPAGGWLVSGHLLQPSQPGNGI
jgi:hypothetical protein